MYTIFVTSTKCDEKRTGTIHRPFDAQTIITEESKKRKFVRTTNYFEIKYYVNLLSVEKKL